MLKKFPDPFETDAPENRRRILLPKSPGAAGLEVDEVRRRSHLRIAGLVATLVIGAGTGATWLISRHTGGKVEDVLSSSAPAIPLNPELLHAPSDTFTLRELLEIMRNSAVELHVQGVAETIPGIVLEPGNILTAAAAFRDNQSIEKVTQGENVVWKLAEEGSRVEFRETLMSDEAAHSRLQLVFGGNFAVKSVNPLKTRLDFPQSGESIYFSHGAYVTSGHVSERADRKIYGLNVMHAASSGRKPDIGEGVFDAQGKLVGIVVGHDNDRIQIRSLSDRDDKKSPEDDENDADEEGPRAFSQNDLQGFQERPMPPDDPFQLPSDFQPHVTIVDPKADVEEEAPKIVEKKPVRLRSKRTDPDDRPSRSPTGVAKKSKTPEEIESEREAREAEREARRLAAVERREAARAAAEARRDAAQQARAEAKERREAERVAAAERVKLFEDNVRGALRHAAPECFEPFVGRSSISKGHTTGIGKIDTGGSLFPSEEERALAEQFSANPSPREAARRRAVAAENARIDAENIRLRSEWEKRCRTFERDIRRHPEKYNIGGQRVPRFFGGRR